MERFIPKGEVERLIRLLMDRGYSVVAPVFSEGVILFREISSPEEMARGVREEQGRGYYRAREEGDSYFGYVHGPNSIKEFVHPPEKKLLRIKPDLSQDALVERKKFAFVGIRGCDVSALSVLDRVFLGQPHEDVYYRALRGELVVVGVNCTSPSQTCFCATMGTGPRIREGYDISLTELREGFIARAVTELGEELLGPLEGREPEEGELEEENRLLTEAEERMGRSFGLEGLPEKLLERVESPLWGEVAKRCLACGSCTMVCPTCFCYEVVDEVSVDGSESVRFRRWDVCFREGFSAIHGVPLRQSVASRYRQWLMHKFSYWMGQFGVFGCVGCGRCITWCPVGIDIREEVRGLLEGG